MADYYPLLVRSLENVADPRPETRHKVYEKARTALITQLRNIRPPLSEAEILHECMALDEAVLAVEQLYIQGENHNNTGQSYIAPPSGNLSHQEPVAGSHYYESQPSPQHNYDYAPENVPNYSGQGYHYPDDTQQNLYNEPLHNQDYPPQYPVQPAHEAYSHQQELPHGNTFLHEDEDFPPYAASPAQKDLRPRLIIQETAEDNVNKKRRMIVLATILALVFTVAGLALTLKLRDDQLPVYTAQSGENGDNSEDGTSGSGNPASQSLPPKSGARVGAAPVTEGADIVQETSNIEQRAFLIEQTALEPPNHQKRTVGGVVWKLENKDAPQGRTISVIHGHATFPDADMALDIQINKNTDLSLSASHTILFRFSSISQSPAKQIKSFHHEMFMMAHSDMPAVKLEGGAVELDANSFVFALQDSPENMDIFKKLSWFRIFFIYESNQTALIYFEKGPEGQRVFEEALRNWEQ